MEDEGGVFQDGHLELPGMGSGVPCVGPCGVGPPLPLASPSRSSPRSQASSDTGERFSRKVFVGGLPPDIDEGKDQMLKFRIIEL